MFGISLAALLSICGATRLRDYKVSNEDTLSGMLDEVEAMEMMLKDLLADETKEVLNAGMDDKEDLDIFSDVGTEGNNLAAQQGNDNKGRMRSFDLIDPVSEVNMFNTRTRHLSIPIVMNNTNTLFLQSMKDDGLWMEVDYDWISWAQWTTHVANGRKEHKDRFKWQIFSKNPKNEDDKCIKYGEKISLRSVKSRGMLRCEKPEKYYHVTNGDCASNGYDYITNAEECRTAGSKFAPGGFGGSDSTNECQANRPRNCGLWGKKFIHYNARTSGRCNGYNILQRAEQAATMICKGKQQQQQTYMDADPVRNPKNDLDDNDEFHWIIRSTTGEGEISDSDIKRDRMHNKCVTYNSVFYLQSMSSNYRFLSPGSYTREGEKKGSAGVYVVDHLLPNRDQNLLKWIARPGNDFNSNGERTHAKYLLPDSSAVEGRWIHIFSASTASWSRSVTLTVSVEENQVRSDEVTSDWSTSVAASVSAGLDLYGVGSISATVEVGSTLSKSMTNSVSSSISHRQEETDTIQIQFPAPAGDIWKFETKGKLINANNNYQEESWVVDTGHYMSTLTGQQPCCPPGFFTNSTDPKSDCKIPEYNLCRKQKH